MPYDSDEEGSIFHGILVIVLMIAINYLTI